MYNQVSDVHVYGRYDKERLEEVGPDRLCAEWILKAGGRIRWQGHESWSTDFNFLPPDNFTLKLVDVDASQSEVMTGGFVHFGKKWNSFYNICLPHLVLFNCLSACLFVEKSDYNSC